MREFADAEIAPHAREWDRTKTFPLDAVKKMADLGLFGLPFEERYGGSESDFATVCIAIEELARVDQSMAITLEAAVGLGITPIAEFGTAQQKEEWLPDLIAGRKLAAFGLTEPDAGSDAGATRTKADLIDGAWHINGSKAFITNSGTDITSLVTITARTAPEEISTIIVPADTPGLEVEPAYDKMGWHASDTHGLNFTDCVVPEENLLGERGQGFRQFLHTLDDGRIAIAALAVGVLQSCLEETTAYAKERTSFGRAIGAYQGVAFKIANIEVCTEAARLLTYKAAWLKDTGQPYKHAAARAKLYATEAAVKATREATQIFGG
ncbi:MAG: acyl-CoA dehydrogenase family protein, partial [Actinomycetota bacterium]